MKFPCHHKIFFLSSQADIRDFSFLNDFWPLGLSCLNVFVISKKILGQKKYLHIFKLHIFQLTSKKIEDFPLVSVSSILGYSGFYQLFK